MVWREILSEGPVAASSINDFFTLRSEWISEAYQADASKYQENIIDEYTRLGSFGNYDEILFWFEFDLFCQVNLIFLTGVRL